MENQSKTLITGILLLSLWAGDSPSMAQNTENVPSSKDIVVSLQNVRQIDAKTLEFDIYIMKTNPGIALELASFQAGIRYNAEILNGALPTQPMAEIVRGSSELNDSLVPANINSATPGLIKLAGRLLPGKGKGNIIPAKEPGIRICRLRLTNTVPFSENTSPDFLFTSSKQLPNSYSTRVSVYQNRSSIQIEVMPLGNAIVKEHLVLNPAIVK